MSVLAGALALILVETILNITATALDNMAQYLNHNIIYAPLVTAIEQLSCDMSDEKQIKLAQVIKEIIINRYMMAH